MVEVAYFAWSDVKCVYAMELTLRFPIVKYFPTSGNNRGPKSPSERIIKLREISTWEIQMKFLKLNPIIAESQQWYGIMYLLFEAFYLWLVSNRECIFKKYTICYHLSDFVPTTTEANKIWR